MISKAAPIRTIACVCAVAWTTPARSQARTIDDHIEDVRDKYTQRRDITLETRLVMDKRQAKAFRTLKKKFDLEWDAVNETYFGLIAERVSPVVAVQFSQIHRRYDLEIQRSAYAPLAE